MPELFQTQTFAAKSEQTLKNVMFHFPTIIWVTEGCKQLYWQGEKLTLDRQTWLLIPAGVCLSFINQVTSKSIENNRFYSRVLTIYASPPKGMLVDNYCASGMTKVEVKAGLAWCFETLFKPPPISNSAQKYLVDLMFAELSQLGKLQALFPSADETLRYKLSRYFSADPSANYKLDDVAGQFHMSRATLMRKLAAEYTSFKEILSQVRMMHALTLFQGSMRQLDVALACGYQSEARFSEKFKQVFGLSPKEYQQTL